MSNSITVYRFCEVVSDAPLDLVRAIVKTTSTDRLGEVMTEANDAVRGVLPDGHEAHLPVTGGRLEPIVVATGHIQVTWIEIPSPQ